MKINNSYIRGKYPFKIVWEKQKKSIIVTLTLFIGLAALVFSILWYLFSEKEYFGDLKLINLNVIDFYLAIIGLVFVILIIVLVLIPFVVRPFFLIIYNAYKKFKYLLKLWNSEIESSCIINIPKLNIAIKGGFNIDFHNNEKLFREASFKVNKIKGNNWRIGIKLLDINGNNEIFVFHPYIDQNEQHYLSFRLINKEKNSEIDKSFNDYDLEPIKPFKYKILFSNNLLRCFINDLQIKKINGNQIDGIPISEANLHSVRFHLWGLHKNTEISLELSNLLIVWD